MRKNFAPRFPLGFNYSFLLTSTSAAKNYDGGESRDVSQNECLLKNTFGAIYKKRPHKIAKNWPSFHGRRQRGTLLYWTMYITCKPDIMQTAVMSFTYWWALTLQLKF